MTVESDLAALLQALCPRVSPDFAPAGTARPFITYQAIAGQALRFADNTAADKRHTLMQINVWAASRAAALLLVRQVEDAMCSATAFTARPAAEPSSDSDSDLSLYGCLQDFDIWSAR